MHLSSLQSFKSASSSFCSKEWNQTWSDALRSCKTSTFELSEHWVKGRRYETSEFEGRPYRLRSGLEMSQATQPWESLKGCWVIVSPWFYCEPPGCLVTDQRLSLCPQARWWIRRMVLFLAALWTPTIYTYNEQSQLRCLTITINRVPKRFPNFSQDSRL